MRAMLTGAALGVVLGATAVGVSAVAWPDAENSAPRYEAAFEQLSLFTEVMARAKRSSLFSTSSSRRRSLKSKPIGMHFLTKLVLISHKQNSISTS